MPGRGNPEYQGPEMRRNRGGPPTGRLPDLCGHLHGPLWFPVLHPVSHCLGPNSPPSGSSWLTPSKPVHPGHSPKGGTASPHSPHLPAAPPHPQRPRHQGLSQVTPTACSAPEGMPGDQSTTTGRRPHSAFSSRTTRPVWSRGQKGKLLGKEGSAKTSQWTPTLASPCLTRAHPDGGGHPHTTPSSRGPVPMGTHAVGTCGHHSQGWKQGSAGVPGQGT